MDTKSKINDDILLIDGVERCITAPPGEQLSGVDTFQDELLQCIRIAEAAGDNYAEILLGKFAGDRRKVVVQRWKTCNIAVEVKYPHPINKSLRRSLKRLCKKYGETGDVVHVPSE